jgi:hypothetical protein
MLPEIMPYNPARPAPPWLGRVAETTLRAAVRANGGPRMQKAFKDDLVSEQFCTESAQSAGLGSRRWLLQVSRTKVGRALLEG